jgi:hypothetical protein
VLGGPLLAGEYQPHSHHAGAALAAGSPGAAAGVTGATGLAPFVQPLGSQVEGGSSGLPVAVPDKIVTPSQQVLMGEEQ